MVLPSICYHFKVNALPTGLVWTGACVPGVRGPPLRRYGILIWRWRAWWEPGVTADHVVTEASPSSPDNVAPLVMRPQDLFPLPHRGRSTTGSQHAQCTTTHYHWLTLILTTHMGCEKWRIITLLSTTEHHFYLKRWQVWVIRLGYLAEIFLNVKEVNMWLQENQLAVFIANDEIQAFRSK